MPAAQKTIIVPPETQYSQLPPRVDRLEGVNDGVRKYENLLHHFETIGPIPIKEGSTEVRELDDDEKQYLSRECLTRFLIAVKGNVEATKTRLTKHLVWRRTFNCYNVAEVAETIKGEVTAGKQFSVGYSLNAQPLFYLIPSKVDTKPSITQVQFVVFMAERAVDLMPGGVESLLFCVDLSGKPKTQSGAMSVNRQILSILQTHYVERLGVAAILSMPWIGSLFLTLLWPFIDPVTKTKIKTNVNLAEEGIVAPEMLLKQYGGELEFDYDPDVYFPDLLKKCLEVRAANTERWRALGGKIGLSEWDFRMPIGTPKAP